MISDNIQKIKALICVTCLKIKQDPLQIIVMAVAKGREIDEIKEAISAGITDIGENKVQEAIIHYNAIRDTPYAIRTKWHMIGHLQTNKVKEAVKIFDLIHSVDSLHLAEAINEQAVKINKVQDVLIEVNCSGEINKFGIKPDEIAGLVKEMLKLKNINLKGLMTIAPVVDDPEKTRPYFKLLKKLSNEINDNNEPNEHNENNENNAIRPPQNFGGRPPMHCGGRNTHDSIRVLSMGMSDDFQVAIEEGSNMVRLGRAIFAS